MLISYAWFKNFRSNIIFYIIFSSKYKIFLFNFTWPLTEQYVPFLIILPSFLQMVGSELAFSLLLHGSSLSLPPIPYLWHFLKFNLPQNKEMYSHLQVLNLIHDPKNTCLVYCRKMSKTTIHEIFLNSLSHIWKLFLIYMAKIDIKDS